MLSIVFVPYWRDLNCVYCSSQRSPSPGPNHVTSSINSAPSAASAPPTTSAARTSCSLTPSLSSHFNENLIRHVQGWPAEHVEKQVCSLFFVPPRLWCHLTPFINPPGIQTTWGGSHHGEHLFVWELHRAKKPAFFGPSLWNPSNAARAEVSTCKRRQIWARAGLSVAFFSSTGYSFWDSKSKNLKSWRIRILSWSEN